MNQIIEIWAIVHCGTVGLSHIFQPRVWASLFMRLSEQAEVGVFVVALPGLGFASIIVVGHNQWQGVPLLLTLYGWALFIKSLVYLIKPKWGLKALARIAGKPPRYFIVPGLFLLLLAATLAVNILMK